MIVVLQANNYNPVRQYNNSKPDKYRIDFFIFANAPVDTISFITLMSNRKNTNKKNTNKKLELPKIFENFPQHRKRLWMQQFQLD